MKKLRWKLVVNRWHKMTLNQVILLTNWQLIYGRTTFLRGCRKLRDVIYFLLHHWFEVMPRWIVISFLRYWSLRSLYNFINNAELLRKYREYCHDIRERR